MQAVAQITFGVFGLLSAATTFRGRRWWPLALACFTVSLTIATGLKRNPLGGGPESQSPFHPTVTILSGQIQPQHATLGMNAGQRRCATFGLLTAVTLVLVPPWRYYVRSQVHGPGYSGTMRREVRSYSLRSNPPEYHHAWRRGVEQWLEHIDEPPRIDGLRLGFSISALIILLLAANGRLANSLHRSWRSWSTLSIAGILTWAALDHLLVTYRSWVEGFLLTGALDRYLDELLALPVRIIR